MTYKYTPTRRWKHHLDFNGVWHTEPEDEMQHERLKWTEQVMFDKRDGVVEVMKSLPWYTTDEESDTFDDQLWWIVDEMSDVDNTDWFNMVWSGFYDYCDDMGIWVDIHNAPKLEVVK